MQNDCIFCRIIGGKVPSAKLYEDENVYCFLDIMPANKGHTLIIPKKHYARLLDIPDETLHSMVLSAKKIAKALSLSVGNKAYNVLMNNGSASGQAVDHAHIHIIPRFEKDSVGLKWRHTHYSKGEIEKFAEKIKKFI